MLASQHAVAAHLAYRMAVGELGMGDVAHGPVGALTARAAIATTVAGRPARSGYAVPVRLPWLASVATAQNRRLRPVSAVGRVAVWRPSECQRLRVSISDCRYAPPALSIWAGRLALRWLVATHFVITRGRSLPSLRGATATRQSRAGANGRWWRSKGSPRRARSDGGTARDAEDAVLQWPGDTGPHRPREAAIRSTPRRQCHAMNHDGMAQGEPTTAMYAILPMRYNAGQERRVCAVAFA